MTTVLVSGEGVIDGSFELGEQPLCSVEHLRQPFPHSSWTVVVVGFDEVFPRDNYPIDVGLINPNGLQLNVGVSQAC